MGMAAQSNEDATRKRRIAEAAQRALAEAEARRGSTMQDRLPPEVGGVKGAEPTRHGDWEKDGIASDF